MYLKEDADNCQSVVLGHGLLKQAVLVRIPVDQMELKRGKRTQTHFNCCFYLVDPFRHIHLFSMSRSPFKLRLKSVLTTFVSSTRLRGLQQVATSLTCYLKTLREREREIVRHFSECLLTGGTHTFIRMTVLTRRQKTIDCLLLGSITLTTSVFTLNHQQ